jgi:hypothetical protein
MNVMADGEFRTRREIAELTGQVKKQQRWWFKVGYGSQSALANLVNRGMLRRSAKRIRKRGGKGQTAYEYWMPLDVLRIKKHRRVSAA